MNTRLAGLLLILFLVLAGLPATASPTGAQSDERCFSETGFCMAGPIRAYWERNGGLPVFGYPITAQAEANVEGRALQVQWFERDRLEIQANGSVTAGRLGVERLLQIGRPWRRGEVVSPETGCMAFPEATGHTMCGEFARYWNQNGGLERFGYPITGKVATTIEGRDVIVQYTERRRFELHDGNVVMLGLLGREVLDHRR